MVGENASETRRDRVENIGTHADLEFDALYTFVAKTTELYQEWEKRLNQDYSTVMISADQNEPFLRQAFQRTLESKDNMHSLLYNTTFTSCVGVFEHFLQELCKILTIKESITLDDLKGGSYILKAKVFLTKCAGINLQPEERLWARIFLHAELRNKIVHEQSKVKINLQKNTLYNRLQALEGLSITPVNGTVALIKIDNADFIVRYIGDTAKYLRFVIDAVRLKIIEKGIGEDKY